MSRYSPIPVDPGGRAGLPQSPTPWFPPEKIQQVRCVDRSRVHTGRTSKISIEPIAFAIVHQGRRRFGSLVRCGDFHLRSRTCEGIVFFVEYRHNIPLMAAAWRGHGWLPATPSCTSSSAGHTQGNPAQLKHRSVCSTSRQRGEQARRFVGHRELSTCHCSSSGDAQSWSRKEESDQVSIG